MKFGRATKRKFNKIKPIKFHQRKNSVNTSICHKLWLVPEFEITIIVTEWLLWLWL